MENDLISVIVPIYNVEKYLNKCLDSIINQTYKNLEIILIDDGSPDKCPQICDEYAKKDKRIKVIHKENGGVSSARNKGLDIMNGEYVQFVDGDDYLELDMIEKMYRNSKQYNVDISICNYFNEQNNQNTKGSTLTTPNKKLNKKEFYRYLFYNTYYCGYLWNKLFKRKSIRGVKFHNNIHLLEDLLFISEVSDNCTKFYYDYDEYLYHYVIHKNSALHSNFNIKQLSSILAREKCLKYAKKYQTPNQNIIKFNILWDSIYYKYKLKNIPNGFNLDFKKYRKYLLSSLVCKEISILKRVRLAIIYFFPNTYFSMKKIKNGRKGDKDEK